MFHEPETESGTRNKIGTTSIWSFSDKREVFYDERYFGSYAIMAVPTETISSWSRSGSNRIFFGIPDGD